MRTEVPTDNGYFYAHVGYVQLGELRRLAKQYPCLVPMRHPMSVALSYKARRENIEVMTDYFRRLVTAIDPLKPFYLPLDVPNRQHYLDLINDVTGLELTTDWHVHGSIGEQGKLTGTDHPVMADFMEELSGFFGRFGYVA